MNKTRYVSTFRLPEGRCYQCHLQLDAATHLDGHEPMADDLTVCIRCGAIMRFNELRVPVRMEQAELDALVAESGDELYHALHLLIEMSRGRQEQILERMEALSES